MGKIPIAIGALGQKEFSILRSNRALTRYDTTYIGRIPTAQKELTATTPTEMGLPTARSPKETLEIEMLLAHTAMLHCSVCLL